MHALTMGGDAPRPSYLLCELAFSQICAPQSKTSSYVYANYNLTQAIQCYQKNCKGVQNFVYDPYMLVLTEKIGPHER